MVLTDKALTLINTVSTRIALAAELNVGEQTIINHIKLNKDNGILTTQGALKIIKQHTRLADHKILKELTVKKVKLSF